MLRALFIGEVNGIAKAGYLYSLVPVFITDEFTCNDRTHVHITLMGCTTMTDWKKDSRNVLSHSLALEEPHSILYRIVKNAGAMMLKKHTETKQAAHGQIKMRALISYKTQKR